MKLLIASDIHGDIKCAEALINVWKNEAFDKLVILGDILYHGPRNDLPANYNPKAVIALLNEYKENLLCVRGNCDTEVDQMVLKFPVLSDSAQIFDGKVTMFLSHGHIFNPAKLPPVAKNSVFLYGHTHVQKIEYVGDTLCLNPGSVTLPKENNPKTYAVYENGTFKICDFDGNVINSIEI